MRTHLLIASIGVFLCAPAFAHHSFGAEYDESKPVNVTGVVTKVDWENPHMHFYIDVKDDSGVTHWKFEAFPPNMLVRQGWHRDITMKVGDTVTVFGWRARDGSTLAHSREVTWGDGHKLLSGPPANTGGN
ncbi:MAG TPA: DUF6152 family protein [Bryobacteraceae bacterium]|nr:DUF6152 family protein [Bryobacteraceae bacterium]